MSVDCHIYLPGDVRVDDVAMVLGIAAGLPVSKVQSNGVWFLQVKGVSVKTTCNPSLAQILLEGPMVDGEARYGIYYHFESGHRSARLLIAPSTPFWIAAGRKVVDFFGGKIDFQDSDEIRVDYSVKKPRRANNPEDGQAFQDFQEALRKVSPLTKADLATARRYASYR